LTFSEVFTKLEVKYDQDQDLRLRKNWQDVSFHTQGKLTCQEWEDFESKFRSAMELVKDVTPGEAIGLLHQKVPNYVETMISGEEERLRSTAPTVRMNVPVGFTEASVSASLKKIVGVEPTKVSKIGEGKYEVVVSSLTEIVKLQNLNGKYFERSDQKIRVEEKNISLDVDEIFLFVKRKLTLQERNDLRGSGGRSQGNENKHVRAATAEPRRNPPSNLPETGAGKTTNEEKKTGSPLPEQRRPSVSPRRNSNGGGGGVNSPPPPTKMKGPKILVGLPLTRATARV
jgi:hypothetical protein